MKRKEITLESFAKSLDDIANSIADLATMFAERFDIVERRLDKLEIAQRETNQRLTSLEASIYRIDVRLDNLESEAQATRSDIRELYALVA